MLTWAICWMITQLDKGSMAGEVFFTAFLFDAIIFFFIACAFRGWPIQGDK